MKLFAVLGLIGLALAASPALRAETQYRSDREYRYEFSGRIASALPLDSRQNAFTNIKTDVIIQTETDEQWFTMKLQQVRIFAEQQKKMEQSVRIQEDNDYDSEKRDQFSPVKIDKEHLETLSLPIRVHYQNGLISEIELLSEEKPWSANIKKAVLNMIQVNILKKSPVSESSDEEDRTNAFFKSVERTIEGECEVSYTLVEKSEKLQQWTKSVDFQKCQKRPVSLYGMRFNEQCNECDATKKSDQLYSTVSSMEVSRDGEGFLVREVELVSRIQFGTVGPRQEQQVMTAEVKNRLSLKEVTSIRNKIEWISKHTEKTNLIYSADVEYAEEKFQMTGDEKWLRQVPLVMKNKEEIVEKLIKKIAVDLDTSEIQPETSHTMARIVKVLRYTTEQELRNMEEMIQRLPTEKREQVLPIWYDCLALAGTKVTLRSVFNKIESSEVSVVKATQIFKMISEIRFASEEIIEDLSSVCKSVESRSSVLHQSCWLSMGSVVNSMCGQHQDRLMVEAWKEEKMCPKSLKKRFVSMFMDKINRASSRYEKVLFLKSLANAGIDTSVVEIEKLIRDPSVEKIVRLQSIEALRRLRSTMSRKIQQILMPIYRNPQEDIEVRTSAYNMIIMTRPSSAILNQIVMGLETERSQQVKSFVYTALKAVTVSELPTDQCWKDRVIKALDSIPEITRRQMDSRAATVPLRFANVNFGSLFSNDSILPKEVMTSLDTMFAGQWTRYMAQAGIYQHNIDQVITQVLSKVEESGLEQLVVRGKRSVLLKPADILRGMIEKLRISIRHVDKEEPHSMLYFRYKDMDYAFMPIDIDTIPEILRSIVRDGQIQLSEIESLIAKQIGYSYRAAMFVYETTHKMPTALGLPVVFGAKMPTVGSIEGNIKIDLQPKNSDNFWGVRMIVKAQPKLATTHVVKMEVLTPFVTSGVKLIHVAKIITPIDMEISSNWQKQFQLKTVVRPATEKVQIFHGYSRPATFVRHLKKEIRHYPETAEQTVLLRESKYPVNTIDREYFEQTGMKMLVSGQIRESPSGFRWPMVLFADNSLDITIEPTSQVPKEIVGTFEVEMFQPTSRMERPSFEDFYRSEEGVFKTETSELKEESEESRREEFNQYWKNIKTDKAYKYRVFAKVETVGAGRNLRAEGDLTATCEEKMRYCTVKMECRRSPIYEDETRDWKLEVTAQSLYPEQPSSLKSLWTQLHREFHGLIEARWGSSDRQEKVSLRLQGAQSRNQKKWMKRVDREQNQLSQQEKLTEAARLDQYKMIADYEISPKNQWILRNWFAVLKSWKLLSTSVEVEQNKESRVMIELSIEPEARRYFNLTVRTPEERVQIEDLRVPFGLPTLNIHLQPETIKEHGIRHIANHIEKNNRAECVVKSREVSTFDETVFRAPLTTCYSVLAKDCSSEQPKFAVLMKKLNKNGEEKKLRILNEKNVIEVEMISEEELKITVNGKTIPRSETERLEEYGIWMKKTGTVRIDIDHVVVDFDGFETRVKLSPLFKNKQCGVCGHYDGESSNDLRRADNFQVSESSEIESFHRSFLSEDDECEKDESELSQKKNYRLKDEETSSSEEEIQREESVEPIKRVRMIERGHRVCFTTEPVSECPKGTVDEESRNVETRVKCLDRSETQAKKLIREIRKKHHNVQEQLSKIEEESRINIRLPKMCSIY